jgi:hypothetical protein
MSAFGLSSPAYAHWAVYKILPDTWAGLVVATFSCGCERTEANTLINRYPLRKFRRGKVVKIWRETKRCRRCHNERALEWARQQRTQRMAA